MRREDRVWVWQPKQIRQLSMALLSGKRELTDELADWIELRLPLVSARSFNRRANEYLDAVEVGADEHELDRLLDRCCAVLLFALAATPPLNDPDGHFAKLRQRDLKRAEQLERGEGPTLPKTRTPAAVLFAL